MGSLNNKGAVFRQVLLALGVAGLVLTGVLFQRGQIAAGFLAAAAGLSLIAAAETELDVNARLNMRSFGKLLAGRTCISMLGQMCDIASYFCLAAALISWIVLR